MELKPCPFCGSKVEYQYTQPADMPYIFKIYCACGANIDGFERDEVIEKWNKRDTSDLHKLVERLKDRVDGYTPLDSDIVFCISELEALLKRGE